jgi:hypothetical protein
MSIFVETEDRTGSYLAIVEDDDRAAHAYLHARDGKVIATAWLYNTPGLPAPKSWKDAARKRGDTPRNIAECGGDTYFAPIVDESDVKFYFLHDDDDNLVNVKIYLRKEPHAVLIVGEPIGWSILASRDGMLAHALEREQVSPGSWALTYNELRNPAVIATLPSE